MAVPTFFPSLETSAARASSERPSADSSAALAASYGAARSAPSLSAPSAAYCAASTAAYTPSIDLVGSIMSVRATLAQYWVCRAPSEMATTP